MPAGVCLSCQRAFTYPEYFMHVQQQVGSIRVLRWITIPSLISNNISLILPSFCSKQNVCGSNEECHSSSLVASLARSATFYGFQIRYSAGKQHRFGLFVVKILQSTLVWVLGLYLLSIIRPYILIFSNVSTYLTRV